MSDFNNEEVKTEQQERLDYLLEEMKEDSIQYKDLETGDDYQDKRLALRALMNIRMPGYISDNILKVQDCFLQEEAQEKGIVSLSDIPNVKEQYGSIHEFADMISI